MSLVNIQNIQFQNNPSPFMSPIKVDITFECLKPIAEAIEWQIVYIGSAKDEQYDQQLDKFEISNLEAGVMNFTVETNPPNYTLIPSKDDLLGVTAIILAVSFRGQEFFRVGYYVYNQYTDPALIENDPPQILIDKVERQILSDRPRITHFNIKWGTEDEASNNRQYPMDPNTLAILQQQHASQGMLPDTLRNELNAVNSQMFSTIPDPFAKSSGILQELSNMPLLQQQSTSANQFMFGSTCEVPQNQFNNNQYAPNNINNQNQFQPNSQF